MRAVVCDWWGWGSSSVCEAANDIVGDRVRLSRVYARLLIYLTSPPLLTHNTKQVQLTEEEVRMLCTRSREIFLSQPILVEMEVRLRLWGGWMLIQVSMVGCTS